MRVIYGQPCSSVMGYPGGKTLNKEWVNQHLPRSASAYIEGFAGSLAVGLSRPRVAFEVVNDFDPGVSNLYRVIQSQQDELLDRLRFTLHSRAEHEQCRMAEEARVVGEDHGDAVEWAARHLVLIRQSYSAQFAGSWAFSREQTAAGSARLLQLIGPAAARLRNAVVENLHFKHLIPKYSSLGRDALWYLDPPYVPETRVTEKLYRCEMDLSEHVHLMELITSLDGMVVLSGYRSKLYDDALHSWMRVEKIVPCYSARAVGGTKPKRTECLWLNPATVDRLRREGRFPSSGNGEYVPALVA